MEGTDNPWGTSLKQLQKKVTDIDYLIQFVVMVLCKSSWLLEVLAVNEG